VSDPAPSDLSFRSISWMMKTVKTVKAVICPATSRSLAVAPWCPIGTEGIVRK
jgi:hypothetical protein